MQDKFEHKIKSQLENYEISPSPMAWENISSALKEEKPKGFVWAPWMRIAAALVVPALLTIGIFFLKDDTSKGATDMQETHISQSPIDNNSSKNDYHPTKTTGSQKNSGVNAPSNLYDASTIAKDTHNLSTTDKVKQFFSNLFEEDKTTTHDVEEYNYMVDVKENKNIFTTISDFLYDNDQDLQPAFSSPELYAYYTTPTETELQVTAFNAEEVKTKKVKSSLDNKFLNNLTVSPYAGVAMLSSWDQPSLIAPAFNALDIDNKVATAFGANASYQINDRLKMRSGIGVLDLTQDTYDVPLSYNVNDNSIAHNVKSFTNVNVDFSEAGYSSDFTTMANSSVGGIKQNLSHQVQFIEVPVEVEYALTQGSKLNVAATGGMSTLFLNKNEVYLKEMNTVLAKSTNIKSVSFSANAGVKLGYEVTDKISINVEPQLKYMINTVTANDDIQPYLLGVNAGISYSL